jgi:ATP-dependent Clp protease ATP-binding subunit ClpA
MATTRLPRQSLRSLRSLRYSQHARRTLNYARLLAKESGHAAYDSTHLFMGIISESGSVGSSILKDLPLDVRHAERAFRQMPRVMLDAPAPINPAAAPAVDSVLALAADEARWLDHPYIGTEHLLLGLARAQEPVLLDLFRALEISPEQIRRSTRRRLQEGITEISLEQAKRVARLSELSRRVFTGAEQFAEQMGHKYVGLAHLLLVLSGERRSVCARLLREAGLNMAMLEANLIKPRPVIGGRLDDVIDQAVNRAERFGSHYTGTEHLLLALALDPRGARLLRRYEVNPRAVVQPLRAMLTR